MRSLVSLFAVLTASACAADLAEGPPPPPDTMRERLAASTRLLVDAAESGGTLTAERKVQASWEGGLVNLAIANGELVVSSTADASLTLEELQVTFEPLDIPDGVFGTSDAQLRDVRIDLTAPQTVPATWISDNEVLLAANLDLTLSWKIALDGTPAPLGSPHLPKVPVAIVLTGSGANVQAEIRAQAPGELWMWAGLVKLSNLALVMGASLGE